MRYNQVKSNTLFNTEEGNVIYIHRANKFQIDAYFITLTKDEVVIEKTNISQGAWHYLFEPQDLIQTEHGEFIKRVFTRK